MKLTERDMEYFLYKAVYWVGIALKEGQFRISQSERVVTQIQMSAEFIE